MIFPKTSREIMGSPPVSKMTRLFKLIALANWSNFWLKKGSLEEGYVDAGNGESLAAIRGRERGLFRRWPIVMIFAMISSGVAGNPPVSEMAPLF